jgi:oligopeptide/dipeptide ABC transporter ATP-binding protein
MMSTGASPEALLNVDSVTVYHPNSSARLGAVRSSSAKVVDSVSLFLRQGETLAVIGESGSGKTTLARSIMRLIPVAGGKVVFRGQDLAHLDRRSMRRVRRDMQMVFQDMHGSLSPDMKLGDQIAEPLVIHKIGTGRAARRSRVAELVEMVGLPSDVTSRYAHMLSGGQRQRVCIARALATNPSLLVLDEPVSALDVSIQAQILVLLQKLQSELGTAYLLVTHDLAVVRHVADRIAVMYKGRIVEAGTTEEVFGSPSHPYTAALLEAVPIPDPELETRRHRQLKPAVPLPTGAGPEGCIFRSRCPYAIDDCDTAWPPQVQRSPTHAVACFRAAMDKAWAPV